MIHLVLPEARGLYRSELVAMHRERKRRFVDERGWRLPVRDDGGEYDAYDDDLAHYLIGFDATGDIAVSARLRSTATGGLIPDVFPELVSDAEPPLRRTGVFECTRYFSRPDLRGARGFEMRSKLHLALIEATTVLAGVRLIGFSDLGLLTSLRRFSGLRLRPIGLPAAYAEGGTAIAFEIGVGVEDLEHARRTLGIDARQLYIARQAGSDAPRKLEPATATADEPQRFTRSPPSSGEMREPALVRASSRGSPAAST